MSIHVASLTTGPFQENGYLVSHDSSGKTVLIDPGDKASVFRDHIVAHELEPIAIVNTHSHLDHIGAVAELQTLYKIPFYLHISDKPVLEHYPQSCIMFGLPEKQAPIVDYWMNGEQENLDFGDIQLDVDHTPGHTPGSCCIRVNQEIFTGDTLFQNSIGRTDLPGGDYDTIMASLHRIIAHYDADSRIYPGHGPASTLEIERRQNPFLIHI
ncbi:MAG: MBL fold metallo-hydrolase [Fidelibacterota bacterium]